MASLPRSRFPNVKLARIHQTQWHKYARGPLSDAQIKTFIKKLESLKIRNLKIKPGILKPRKSDRYHVD